MFIKTVLYAVIILSVPNICYASGRESLERLFYVPWLIYNYYVSIDIFGHLYREKEYGWIIFLVFWLLFWSAPMILYFLSNWLGGDSDEKIFHAFTPFENESYAFEGSQNTISVNGAEILYVEFVND